MMEYELINPSDKYTFIAEDFETAALTVFCLGTVYGATPKANSENVSIFLFGGEIEWYKSSGTPRTTASQLGKRLTDLRKECDLSQTDIAGYLGMSCSGIQGYETEGREPNYAALRRIADYFDVSADYLLGCSDERKKPPVERRSGPAFYNVRISCLQYGDVRVRANDPDEAKRKAELAVQSDTMKWFDNEITDMTAEEDEERTFIVTELCPHCETKIEMCWDTDKQGFKTFCPSCG